MKKLYFILLLSFTSTVFSQECVPPINLYVNNVFPTTADLHWSGSSGPEVIYEIVLITAPLPDPTYVPVTGEGSSFIAFGTTAFPLFGLNPGTEYYVYIRKDCGEITSSWSVPIKLTTALCEPAQKCNYKFILTDSNFNGWNGAEMEVRQNGIVLYTLTLTSGSSATRNVPLCPGVPFDVFWTVEGNAPMEIGLSVQNPFLDVLYTKQPSESSFNTVLYSGMVTCTDNPCKKPTNMTAIADTFSAALTWTDNTIPASTAFDVFITAASNPAPETTTTPTHAGVPNPFVVTDLQPGTSYKYYVRASCIEGSVSSWTVLAPYYFNTKPINDEPSAAQLLFVNEFSYCAGLETAGTNRGATSTFASNELAACGWTDDDVWYKFIATGSTHSVSLYNISPASTSAGMGMAIYKETDNNLEYLHCSSIHFMYLPNLIAGFTYYIQVYTLLSDPGQMKEFNICVTSPPQNDDCATAFAIPVNASANGSLSAQGNTLGAGQDLTGSVCGTGAGIWYTFAATQAAHTITFENIAGLPGTAPSYSIYSGSCGSFNLIACANSWTRFVSGLTAGETYFLHVMGANAPAPIGQFTVRITTPEPIVNDDCSTAIPILPGNDARCVFSASGTVTGASGSPDISSCGNQPDDDVWYSFVATTDKLSMTIKNLSAIGNLRAAIYSGACGELTLKSCFTSLTTSNVLDGLIPGVNYYLRIWTANQNGELVSFSICLQPVVNIITDSLSYTPAQLVDVLVTNPCVSISNISISTGTNFGSTNGIGYFFNPGNTIFPLQSGLVLSTGIASEVSGPNLTVLSGGVNSWPGDPQLESLIFAATGTDMESYNATKLEFDFTTLTEYMSFNFMFASEEYGQYQCSFSDSFAFLLTDLVSGTTTNLAVVPNTTDPVSVVTIRNNSFNPACQSSNSEYFDDYYLTNFLGAGDPYISGTNFNGHTKLMTASATIQPNHPYRIKLVIADRGDSSYDSAIFLQAGSFAAGPPSCADKVVLQSFIDSNANGIKDDTELPFTFGSFIYSKNDSNELHNVMSPFGAYIIYDDNPASTYDFSFSINPEFAAFYASAIPSVQNISIATGSGTTVINFPIIVTNPYSDLSITIVPSEQPRAGATYINKIVYKNLGLIPASGTINFTHDSAVTISTVPNDVTPTTTGFTYNFSNLLPYETRSILVDLSLPAIPVVNINDLLTNSVIISTSSPEINLTNNSFTDTQIVVAAYDPNDKMESHGEKIVFSSFNPNDYLQYTIRFQNTGTANAISVVLEDSLDAQLDETSIRMISASHDYILERIGTKLVWRFNYIHLPGAVQDEELSKGYVTFAIKLKPGFAVGDIVPNHALIFFDTNPAIITNNYETEFVLFLGTPELTASNIMVYPNPASSSVEVRLNNTSEELDNIVLYDMVGKAVRTVSGIQGSKCQINVSGLSAGIYMIDISTTGKFRQTHKLVIK